MMVHFSLSHNSLFANRQSLIRSPCFPAESNYFKESSTTHPDLYTQLPAGISRSSSKPKFHAGFPIISFSNARFHSTWISASLPYFSLITPIPHLHDAPNILPLEYFPLYALLTGSLFNWVLRLVAATSGKIIYQALAWMCTEPSQEPDSNICRSR